MDYIEVDLRMEPVEPAREILIARLTELNYDSFQEVDYGLKAFILESRFRNDELDQELSFINGVSNIEYKISPLESKNWNEYWESNFNPIVIPGKCAVRAGFHEPIGGVTHEIVINPKMSFGTGHHETTHLMMEQMFQINFQGKSVLDMGCGTGLLAILAQKLGSTFVVAMDNDQWAIDNCIENCTTNRAVDIVVKKGDYPVAEGTLYHVILANINRNALLSQLIGYQEIIRKKGQLLLSGFYKEDESELLVKAKEAGFELVDAKTRDKWVMLHLNKY